MANRLMQQFLFSFVKMHTKLYMQAAIGSSGAPTISAVNSQGIASIARNSAGNYTITYQDKYNALLSAQHQFILASGAPTAVDMVIRSNTSNTVVVEFVDGTGAAVDPNSGATMLLEICLRNSSSNP